MSIFEIAERFAIKLATEPGGYFRKDPDYDPPEKAPEIEPVKPKKRERRVVPYQPTEEELSPKGPWEEETYEELKPGDTTGFGPSGKKKTKRRPPSSDVDEEVPYGSLTHEQMMGLSDEEFRAFYAEESSKHGDDLRADKIKWEAITLFIQGEAVRQELPDMPDLISLTIGDDDKLLYYDKSSREFIPIVSRMKVKVSQKAFTKLIRELHEK